MILALFLNMRKRKGDRLFFFTLMLNPVSFSETDNFSSVLLFFYSHTAKLE